MSTISPNSAPSTAPTERDPPSTWNVLALKPLVADNSGSAASSVTTVGGKPWNDGSVMKKSALMDCSSCCENDCFKDDPMTPTLATSATPIINADAVDDVRRGERDAFCAASCPGTLNNLATGLPSTRATGPAKLEARMVTPRNIAMAPTAAKMMIASVPPGLPMMPSTYTARPPTVSAPPR